MKNMKFKLTTKMIPCIFHESEFGPVIKCLKSLSRDEFSTFLQPRVPFRTLAPFLVPL